MCCLFGGFLIVIHLGQDVAAYLSVLLGDMKEFGPGEVVVEVVVEMVVLG